MSFWPDSSAGSGMDRPLTTPKTIAEVDCIFTKAPI